jgi:hypothetical protein
VGREERFGFGGDGDGDEMKFGVGEGRKGSGVDCHSARQVFP